MVSALEPEAQSTIYALLQSNGWREPEIKNLHLLDTAGAVLAEGYTNGSG